MGDARHRGFDDVAVLDRALDDLQPRLGLQLPVVAQRADGDGALVARGEQAADEGLPDLAGRAGDQDQGRGLHGRDQNACPATSA